MKILFMRSEWNWSMLWSLMIPLFPSWTSLIFVPFDNYIRFFFHPHNMPLLNYFLFYSRSVAQKCEMSVDRHDVVINGIASTLMMMLMLMTIIVGIWLQCAVLLFFLDFSFSQKQPIPIFRCV